MRFVSKVGEIGSRRRPAIIDKQQQHVRQVREVFSRFSFSASGAGNVCHVIKKKKPNKQTNKPPAVTSSPNWRRKEKKTRNKKTSNIVRYAMRVHRRCSSSYVSVYSTFSTFLFPPAKCVETETTFHSVDDFLPPHPQKKKQKGINKQT